MLPTSELRVVGYFDFLEPMGGNCHTRSTPMTTVAMTIRSSSCQDENGSAALIQRKSDRAAVIQMTNHCVLFGYHIAGLLWISWTKRSKDPAEQTTEVKKLSVSPEELPWITEGFMSPVH